MSYQVLARKWRPRTFVDLVGQQHVVQALSNALEADRLHHAFLFTGTRGVGKTTVARILAKCLNCETGPTASPCGECGACVEVDEGRFVDLIEVDAASRARVDETRELLDNVQYAPTRGRYKVYLIDEVHMFSKHSFNALLKTLEEPPPHVKFLLATTDPQRLPITVLSRCLQFNLRRLPVELIAEQLEAISRAESVPQEDAAVQLLARAADGSMRDALSLLDQAIAFGAGKLEEADVRSMLGTIERAYIVALLDALAEQSAAALMGAVDDLAQSVPDFGEVLDELERALTRIAIVQAVPDPPQDDVEDEIYRPFASRFSPEHVQLYYQIGLIGRRDLPLAPTPRSGFEMTMLRMLSFAPDDDSARLSGPGIDQEPGAGSGGPGRGGEPGRGTNGGSGDRPPTSDAIAATVATAGETTRAVSTAHSAKPPNGKSEPVKANGSASPGEMRTPSAWTETVSAEIAQPAVADAKFVPDDPPRQECEQPGLASQATAPAPRELADPHSGELGIRDAEGTATLSELTSVPWDTVAGMLEVTGLARQLVQNSALVGVEGRMARLALDPGYGALLGGAAESTVAEAIRRRYGHDIKLDVQLAAHGLETPAALRERASAEALAAAQAEIAGDPSVQAICERFEGQINAGSVRPRAG